MLAYKVEQVAEVQLEARCNELAAEGWQLVSLAPHHFTTQDAAPVYVMVWSRPR